MVSRAMFAQVYHRSMKSVRRLLLMALASALGSSFSPTAQASEGPGARQRVRIVTRAIEHHGGEAYRGSETELDVCSKSGCFHVVARVDGDRFAYTVSGKSDDPRREVRWSNDVLEVRENGAAVAIEPGKEQRYRDWAMARVYFCFLPYRLDDPSVIQHDRGLIEWDGRRLHKVKVTFEPGTSTDAGDEYLYWFDPETARLEYFAYSYDDDGGGLRFRRAVRHRRVGGLLFFDQENLGVEGPGLSVEAIDPAYVQSRMRHISTVRLEAISVKPVP